MPQTILIDKGIIYNGLLIPWEVFFEVVNTLSNAKMVERLEKNVKDRVKFDDIARNQETDNDVLSNYAKIVGVSSIKSIEAKIRKLNK